MWKFLLRRLATSVVTVIGVVVIVFFLARITGNPANLYLPEGASPQRYAQFNAQHGFDLPLWEQFLRFLGGAARLDFGDSIWQQRPALQAAAEAMPPTLALSVIALTVSLVLAVPLGAIAARRKFKAVDKAITYSSLTAASVPDFWFALVGVLFLSVQLGLLPTSGAASPAAWVLPVATLTLAPLGVLVQVTRGAMIDALQSGYVQNARARGFTGNRLVYRHALRNAALPIITVAGDRAAGMVNGAIIVGTVFAFPGIGTLIVGAVLNRDFALIQASVFIVGIAVVLLNILVDLTYALADARVRIS
ncbi:ABC transporter permease [Mycobacterium sp. MS1601]|uniref:ABC transporter permease n=1 Tax=Mycobacterium sp. MS1601 TaxID=1936029 RepID=UPI0009792647|nr:ABC transporter permease [Mycobacterium sp. MS1601]AQA01939.1 ABC transporter permease [Mycobacterium sp. MS1601]